MGAHLACTSFLPGGCLRSLSAGVNLTIRAETTTVLAKAGMLAADGRCKALDAAADGYMRGEACVVHLLETYIEGGVAGSLPAAAIVHGTAVNQDGRSSSLTAPNGPSQQAVVRAALQWGGVLAPDICVLEMHGTGTALGDPIEVGAAFAVLQVRPCCPVLGSGAGLRVFPCPRSSQTRAPQNSLQYGARSQPLELQAAKSRVLHTEPAAGAVGLAQLALRLGQAGRFVLLSVENTVCALRNASMTDSSSEACQLAWQRDAGERRVKMPCSIHFDVLPLQAQRPPPANYQLACCECHWP